MRLFKLYYLSSVTCLQPFSARVDRHSFSLLGNHCLSQFLFVSNVIGAEALLSVRLGFTSQFGTCLYLQVTLFLRSLFLQTQSINSTTFYRQMFCWCLFQTGKPRLFSFSLNLQETFSGASLQYPPVFFPSELLISISTESLPLSGFDCSV